MLEKLPLSAVPKLVKDGGRFIEDPPLLLDLVEGLYNYWRTFERFIICDSRFGSLDKRPYRTFDATVESLMHLLRQTYRDVEEHITGRHPSIYRQIHAGAELAVIALRKEFRFPEKSFSPLCDIAVIRQLLMYPPLLLNPPMNKRSGRFERISRNPMELAVINAEEWLCYPAKVGSLLILVLCA
ncbi:MAG: hypothetical protein U5N26_04810 [Candidatus Marinimicrobia bacterium]|nr:hypothetical protein [Candidatus Neomarinimicrobiota bacterium]